jgi:hypothetical protein
MRPHLTAEQWRRVLWLKAKGLFWREIGPRVGCSSRGKALLVRYASRRPVPYCSRTASQALSWSDGSRG